MSDEIIASLKETIALEIENSIGDHLKALAIAKRLRAEAAEMQHWTHVLDAQPKVMIKDQKHDMECTITNLREVTGVNAELGAGPGKDKDDFVNHFGSTASYPATDGVTHALLQQSPKIGADESEIDRNKGASSDDETFEPAKGKKGKK